MKNKVEVKEFLGMEVRVVNDEWIVLKDMFNALGRLNKEDKITSRDRQKIDRLTNYGIICEGTKCTITSKSTKRKSRETQDVYCVRVVDAPMITSQFEPSKKKDGSNDDVIQVWIKFMKFISDLLISLEVDKFIVSDKERHKEHMEILLDEGGSTMIANNQVNIIMAKLIGVYDQGIKYIKKDELKIYQPQTVVDLLEVRDFVMKKFVNAFEFTGSHKNAGDMALKLALKKYKLQ